MKKLLLIVICCFCFCGCNSNQILDEEDDKQEKIEEEKRMCCLYNGGELKNGKCINVISLQDYNSCINNINIDTD